jgi:hypothetical protein
MYYFHTSYMEMEKLEDWKGQELNTVPEVNALQNVYITMKMEESKTTKLLKKLLTAQRFWKLKTIKKN